MHYIVKTLPALIKGMESTNGNAVECTAKLHVTQRPRPHAFAEMTLRGEPLIHAETHQ